MPAYIVAARVPSAHAANFDAALKRYQASFRLCDGTWIIIGDFTASQIHGQLKAALPYDGAIFVSVIGREAEYSNLDTDAPAQLLCHKLI